MYIPFYIQYQPISTVEGFRSSNGGKRKARWYIRIEGLKRVSRALNILSPYIIAKKSESNLVKEFCDRRLSQPGGKNYDIRDFDIIEEVATIHNRNPQRLHAEILEYKSRNKI